MEFSIPFTRPFVCGNEPQYVAEVARHGRLASDGRFTRACAELLQDRFAINKVLMTPSCTAALEMAAILCDLNDGDEVIMPSYTFVSTANAAVLRGARPVFVDVRPDTLNIDENLIEAAITPHTKAIFVVHYAGVACEMDQIMALATRHNLIVVEDAAQGVNALYRDRPLGSIGHLATYSFHTTKNYACGEGGALCINDPRLFERAEIVRDKGTNRSRFLRGQVDKYTWVDIGSSYLPSEMACAFLLGQLEELDRINAMRGQAWQRYDELLAPLAAAGHLRQPIVPEHCRQNYHMYYVLLQSAQARDDLLAHLNRSGIQAVSHYVPLHGSPMGRSFGYRDGALPVTESASGRLLRLPLYADLSAGDQARVVDAIMSYFGGESPAATNGPPGRVADAAARG